MASDFLYGNGLLDLALEISDALALTSTCRAMFHSMGRASIVSRLWSELLDSNPCFEDALVAVSYGHCLSVVVELTRLLRSLA